MGFLDKFSGFMPRASGGVSGIGGLYTPDEQDLLERRAALLRSAEGVRAPQGRMVGGRYIAAKPSDFFVSALRKSLDESRAGDISGQLSDLRAKKQEAAVKDMDQFVQLLRGKEAVAGRPALEGSDTSVLPEYQVAQPGTPGVAANPAAAYALALRSQSPALRQIGLKGFEGMPQLEQSRQIKEEDREAKREMMREQHALRMEQMREQNASKVEMQKAQQGFLREMKSIGAQYGRSGGSGGGASKKEPGWKYDAGSDTWVKPPTEDAPMGISTPNIGKVRAVESLKYLGDKFIGGAGKPGIIDNSTQGGLMGISGAIGRVTNSQSAREFDNTKEQMSTELRKIFRIPGEGALSDKEQAQYGIQLPNVRNSPALNRSIVNDILTRADISVKPAGALGDGAGKGGTQNFKIIGVRDK